MPQDVGNEAWTLSVEEEVKAAGEEAFWDVSEVDCGSTVAGK